MTDAYVLLTPRGRATPRRTRLLPASRAAIAHRQPSPPVDPAPRPSMSLRCASLGFRLTEKRRGIVAALDQIEGPFALEEAYLRCRTMELDVNRSSVFRLISDLVEAKVLTLVGADHRRALYGVPLPVELVIAPQGQPQTKVDDPVLVEMLVAAAARLGATFSGGQILVSIVENAPTHG